MPSTPPLDNWGSFRKNGVKIAILVLCACLGALFSVCFPGAAKLLYLEALTKIYVGFLTYCVPGIVVASVAKSIAKMLLQRRSATANSGSAGLLRTILSKASSTSKVIKRSLVVLAVTAGPILILGAGSVWITVTVGKFIAPDREEMGSVMGNESSEVDTVISFPDGKEVLPVSRLMSLPDFFPSNLFKALSGTYILHVVICAVLLGIAIGLFPKVKISVEEGDDKPPWGADAAIGLLGMIYDIFLNLTNLILLGLPILLFCLFAVFFARQAEGEGAGGQVLAAMGVFIGLFYTIGFFILGIVSVVIWGANRKHNKFVPTMFTLVDPVVTAFATMSSFATMGKAIDTLTEKLGFEKESTGMWMSLLLPVVRFGNAFYFIIATAFFAVVYRPGLSGLPEAFRMSFGGLIASFSTIGTTSIASIQPIDSLFDQFNLPIGAGLVLLWAIDPIMDPMRTALIVHCNTAATAVLAKKQVSIDESKELLESAKGVDECKNPTEAASEAQLSQVP